MRWEGCWAEARLVLRRDLDVHLHAGLYDGGVDLGASSAGTAGIGGIGGSGRLGPGEGDVIRVFSVGLVLW